MCTHCYKLAGEINRHKILSLLKRKPSAVGALAKSLRVTQPTVTHHLKKLEAAGLVRMYAKGRQHFYSLSMKSECFAECGLLKGL